MNLGHRPVWRSVTAAALSATALLAAGCGSSSHSASSKASSSTAATTAAGGSDVSSTVAAAVTAAEKLPTALPISTPLDAAPAKGKTFVWTQCDAPQCPETTQFLQEALSAVGWNLKTVDYQTENPASLVSAMQQALQYKPVAVGLVAQPYAVWSSVVPQYQAAGVKIIPESIGPVTLNSTIPAQIDDPNLFAKQAQTMADWFISDSGGKGHALLWSVPQIGSLQAFDQDFQPTVAKECSGCKVTFLGEPFADVAAGKNVSAIVSALQRDPSINYVISSEQALNTPLAAALKAAGITGVKIAGANVEAADEALIASGTESAGIPTELNLVSWLMVDAALRASEGMPAIAEDVTPTLITPSSHITATDTFAYPADWQSQFKSLWKVS